MSRRALGFAGASVFALAFGLTALSACGEDAPSGGVGTGGSPAVSGAGSVAGGGVSATQAGSGVGGTAAGGAAAGGTAGGAMAGAATGGAGASGVGGSVGGSGVGGAAAGAGARDFSSNRDAFFGASRCAAAGVQFCEDFESGTLDAATWKTGGTAPVIDEVQAARGKKALHVAQGQGNSQIRTGKVFPAMNGRYWGRAFVYLNAMPHYSTDADSLNYSHWTVIAATGEPPRIGSRRPRRAGCFRPCPAGCRRPARGSARTGRRFPARCSRRG